MKTGKPNDLYLQKIVDYMGNWLYATKLIIKTSKCEIMTFGAIQHEQASLYRKNWVQNSCKYLGVNVDKALYFREASTTFLYKINSIASFTKSVDVCNKTAF